MSPPTTSTNPTVEPFATLTSTSTASGRVSSSSSISTSLQYLSAASTTSGGIGASAASSSSFSASTTSANIPDGAAVKCSGLSCHPAVYAAIVVPIVISAILLLLLRLWIRSRRRGSNHAPYVARTKSTGFRKPELEGTLGTRRFDVEPKPELDVQGENTPVTQREQSSTFPTVTTTASPSAAYQEKEVVQPMYSDTRQSAEVHPMQGPSQPVPDPQLLESAPSESSRGDRAHEKAPLLGGAQNESMSPKYAVVTESSPQAQATVDAAQLNQLKAQERELAEYIEAHETLQKLKNEHIALQERIKAAEDRVQRSKTSGGG